MNLIYSLSDKFVTFLVYVLGDHSSIEEHKLQDMSVMDD